MKLTDAIKKLRELDLHGIYVLDRSDIEKLFPDEKEKALEKSLQRLVNEGVLDRACKGIYVNLMTSSKKSRLIEDIAAVARRRHYSYISLESMLSEYGDISQIPMSVLTVMTTGSKGIIKTKYGTIEFTHTQRSFSEIAKKTILVPGRPLRVATREAARQDLLRVGRNVNMLESVEVD